MRFFDQIRKSADEVFTEFFKAFAGLDADFGHDHPARRINGAEGPLREEFEAVRRGGELLASMRRIEALLERIAKAVEPKSADQVAAQLQADIRRGASARYQAAANPLAVWWTRERLAAMADEVQNFVATPEQMDRVQDAADFCLAIDTIDPTPENLSKLDAEMNVLGVLTGQKLQAMQAIYQRARAERDTELLRVVPVLGERWLTPEGTVVIATGERRVDDRGVPCLVMRPPVGHSTSFALFPLRTSDGFSAPGWVQAP